MDFKKIQDLIKLVDDSNISEVRIEEENFKINIKTKHYHNAQQIISASPMAAAPMQMNAAAPTTAVSSNNAAAPKPIAATEADSGSNLITVKAPMIGTFYRRPSPDKDLFVNVGDTVKPGDVLCIIEAMKLFNEIEAEQGGKIVKILVDDSSPVEYDQPLFLIDPS